MSELEERIYAACRDAAKAMGCEFVSEEKFVSDALHWLCDHRGSVLLSGSTDRGRWYAGMSGCASGGYSIADSLSSYVLATAAAERARPRRADA